MFPILLQKLEFSPSCNGVIAFYQSHVIFQRPQSFGVFCHSCYPNFLTIPLAEGEFLCFVKVRWSYDDINIFQINLIPKYGDHNAFWKRLKEVFQAKWFYDGIIISRQLNLNLIGFALWLFYLNLMTKPLADLSVITSSVFFKLIWT